MNDPTRVYGREAVELCKRQWPDLFPELPPVIVAAPQPPMLDPAMSDHDKVAFLATAYLTFMDVHGRLDQLKLHRLRAQSAVGASPQGRSLKRKLLDAANVMAGCAWGELEEVVRNGKIPAKVAPHSWLLFKMQTHFGGPRSGSYPQIEKVFSAGGLLNAKSLRLYSHTSTDLVGGASRIFCGPELSACETSVMRRNLVAAQGVRLDARGLPVLALQNDMPSLMDLHMEEERGARAEEERLARLAQQGVWVWGRWIDERHVKKRYGQSVLMPALRGEVRL